MDARIKMGRDPNFISRTEEQRPNLDDDGDVMVVV
jgi:hypothetical protein